MQKITPFLWFDGDAEEAANFYVSIFKNSKIGRHCPLWKGRLRDPRAAGGEVDRYWEKLSEGGDETVQQCGWLKDKFGLSWQIVPAGLAELLGDKDPERSGRAMQAMLLMKKLDIAKLRQAHTG